MRFTVYAFSPIPDVATARKNFQLEDLSEKQVGKVLYHQRKQRTGHSEALNWDQLQIASVSLVHHSLDYLDMSSHTLGEMPESDLIHRVHNALGRSSQLVSWNGASDALPLLHFRCMKHRISDAAYWQAIRDGQRVHVDLRETLLPQTAEAPSLASLARRFHYPGMLGEDVDSVWEAYLEGDYEAIARYSDYLALNTYLLALQVFSLRGEMSHADAARARLKLRQYLVDGSPTPARYESFLAAWEPDA